MWYNVQEVMALDLLQLQYFQTIARLENISRAAEVLYVAQPNLSASLKRLEQELGVSLFDRRKGRIRLTDTGRLFLSYVDDVLSRLDDGVASVRESERRAESEVRVASAIVDLMGGLLDDFLPHEPDTSFYQLRCRNDEVVDKVLSGEAELGFLFGAPPLQGIEYMEIDRCERVAQLAADHPLARRGGVVTLSELREQRLICNLSRDDRELIKELAHSRRVRVEPFYTCDDNRVELSMSLRGGGVSIAPLSNFLKLRRAYPDEALACLRIAEELPPARLGMIRKSGVRLTPASLRFYEIVTRFFLREAERTRVFAATLPKR